MKKYFLLLYVWLFIAIGMGRAQYTDLLNFTGPNGSSPYGGVTISANTIYGFACYGGAHGDGCIFATQTNGSGYTDLFDFIGNTGANPHNGSLTLSVTGDTLFGMTAFGGTNGDGVIYSIRTNGSGYTDLFNFNGLNGATAYPPVNLIRGKLYGTTYIGGSFGDGVIFSINRDGTGFTILHTFNGADGSTGNAALLNSGDTIFGIGSGGGAYGHGVIFSIQTNGNGYTDLLSFNGTNGSIPNGPLLFSVTRDTLFGMTSAGGANGKGLIFSIKTNGTGYRDILDFNGINGSSPDAGLILSPCGNTLIGLTQFGGANNDGIIFSVHTDGTGFVDIHDFNGLKGAQAGDESLILSRGVLYGVTYNGGTNREGVVFSDTIISSPQTHDSINTCKGQPDTLKVSGGISYLWSNGATTSSIIVSPAASTTYTATAFGLCENSNKIITVNITPSPVPEVTGNKTKCPGIPDTLTASGGLFYKWSNGSTKTNYYTGPINADSTITLIAYNSLGCFHDTTFTINTLPSPKLLITAPSVCIGRQDTITVSGGTRYLWSNGNTSTSYYTGNINADSTIKVTAFNSLGCSHDTTITIHPVPFPKPVFRGASSECKGEIDTVTVSGGTTYLWSTGSSSSSIIVAPGSTSTYSVIVSNKGCIKDTSIEVPVDSNWQGNISGNLTVCAGNFTTLTASGGNSYKWSTGATTSSIKVSPSSITNYSVVIRLNGCIDSLFAWVRVKPLPGIGVCCDSTITVGQKVQLKASGANSFQWSPPTALSCTNCPNPIASPAQTTTYTVTITNDSGCSVTGIVTIDVNCGDVFVPEAFSPNETVNNILYVRSPCISTMDFIVFDRWGNKVFESQNQSNGWDGSFRRQPMNTGTYVWYLKATLLDGTNVVKKGNVALVR